MRSMVVTGCARSCFMSAVIVFMPSLAVAQSAIAGLVTDNTQAVLPGVTVEAASPVLIEGNRVAYTDAQGRFSIVDLRPGTYTVKFSLPGFTTLVRDDVQLPASFTATVNAVLMFGVVEETVTIWYQSPLIDVHRAQRSTVLTRDLLDAVPTSTNIEARAALIPGLRPSVVEVGGVRSVTQTSFSVHGLAAKDNTLEVDGMKFNAITGDGAASSYYNDLMFQEVTYGTSAVTAEVSGGGVRLSMVPRDGGNTFKGEIRGSGAHSSWQADNLTDRLKGLGVRSVNRIDHLYDVALAEGGPVVRHRLWFFASSKRWAVDAPVIDSFYLKPDGTPDFSRPGIDDQNATSVLTRLTWQMTKDHKVAAWVDKLWKDRNHFFTVGADPETASQRWSARQAYMGQVKWMSTLSSRLLLEGGYSANVVNYSFLMQPGISKTPFTVEWYATAPRVDTLLGTSWAAFDHERFIDGVRRELSGKLSYVTGSQSLRVGVQDNFGKRGIKMWRNADLTQNYRSGQPDTVTVYNTPFEWRVGLNYDLGVYVQDNWTMKRLTLNTGVRFEWIDSAITETSSLAGRFVPSRTVNARFNPPPSALALAAGADPSPTASLPHWFDITPRFGGAYDLFGKGRTVLKFGINRYVDPQSTSFGETYNPIGPGQATLPWTDRNRNDIADDGEFDLSRLPTNFGQRSLNTPDPKIERGWNLETSLGVEHEVLRGLVAGVHWYRRSFHDFHQTDNLLRQPTDYRPVTIINPLDGSLMTIYDLVSAFRLSQVDNFDTNYKGDPDLRSQVYNGFEMEAKFSLPRGGSVFGGWTFDRALVVNCQPIDSPDLRFCDQTGGDGEARGQAFLPEALRGLPNPTSRLPFEHEFKISAYSPLPWYGIDLSSTWQSYTGAPAGVTWPLTRNARYPASTELARVGVSGVCNGCEFLINQAVVPSLVSTSGTAVLSVPGTRYTDRINLLNFGVTKWFTFGRVKASARIDVFNLLNSDNVVSRGSTALSTTLSTTYGRPNSVMDARYLQLGTQVKW